jgi:sugar transferase (PEP-CTERM/EpsH1 system associated)
VHILWLKSDLLVPLDKGGKLRTWHLMRHLARRHEITYLSFADSSVRMQDLVEMGHVASRIVTVGRDEAPKGSLKFYTGVARHVIDPLPYAIAKYRSDAYRSTLVKLLAEHPVDLIVCDFLVPAVNLPDQLPCPAVLFTHNVEAEIWRRHTEQQGSTIQRWLYGLQYKRMLDFERDTLARFDAVLAVSEQDRNTFELLYPGATRSRAFVVPTGVDASYFSPDEHDSDRPRLVFTGSMDWLPNEDAMTFFCRDVMPIIRARVPGVELAIVGREPTRGVRNLAAQHGVVVTGRVDDVRPFVREAAVYIVPLRIGGGTRLKIFEAMAMGKAVVSTAVGAEGLPVVHDRHLLIADDPQAFANATVRLLEDSSSRHRLGRAARDLVATRFDWAVVASELETALLHAARSLEKQGTAA